ncbi:MAG: hypothetical protein ACYC6Y_01205 [Thermoguttaceae bacterium]
MIQPEIVREIQRLLATRRFSRRQIAEHLGLARGTVSAVAEGRLSADSRSEQLQSSAAPRTRTPRRCPQCRVLVRMPCRRCRLHRRKAAILPPATPEPSEEAPLALQLKPRHLAGYLEVRRWRREALRRGIVTMPDPPADPPQQSEVPRQPDA